MIILPYVAEFFAKSHLFWVAPPGEGGGALVVQASRPNGSAAGLEAPATMICLICLISLRSWSKSPRIREHIKGWAPEGWLDMFDIFGSVRCAKSYNSGIDDFYAVHD